MTGYQDRYHNGIRTRVVFLNGRRYHDHLITEGPDRGRHFVAVFGAGHRLPRTFGTGRMGGA